MPTTAHTSLPVDADIRLLRPLEVAARLGVSRRTLARMVKAGTFPAPTRLSPYVLRWPFTQVQSHLQMILQQATCK